MSWGAEARLRHRKGGGSRDLSIHQPEDWGLRVLRSASDLSARPPAGRLAASFLSFPSREVELGLPDSPIHQVRGGEVLRSRSPFRSTLPSPKLRLRSFPLL